jgi:cytochrome P450
MEGCRARYGDAFTIRFMHEGTTVLVSHPQDVQRLFTADPSAVHAGEGRRLMLPIFGENSLLCLDEDIHAAQRRLLLPPFHGDRLSAYAELMSDITRSELADCELGRPAKFAPRLRSIALEIILRAVFGIRDAARAAPLRDAFSQLLDLTSSLLRMAPLMLLGPVKAPRIPTVRRLLERVDLLIFSEIAERQGEADLAERPDILSMLLTTEHADGTEMSPVEVRDQLVTLLIGGHETTATGLSWAIERLAHSPQVMERLRSEAMAGQEAYLDAVVKETLRIRSVLPVVSRLVKAPLELRGHTIPAGTIVSACTYLTHHRPEVYPEPYLFRPERFLESAPGTYTWIPFGGGVRRCLGASFAMLEMKTVLKVVSEHLLLKPVNASPEAIGRRAITLVPKNGCEVVCERVAGSAALGAR